MTEVFATLSDVLARVPVAVYGVVVEPTSHPRPAYLPVATTAPVLNLAAGRAQMARLTRMGRRPAKGR